MPTRGPHHRRPRRRRRPGHRRARRPRAAAAHRPCHGRSGSMKHLAALSSLPGMGPARLRVLLEARSPEEAWERVRDGGTTGVPDHVAVRWRDAAATIDVDELWEAHRAAGVSVLQPGTDAW